MSRLDRILVSEGWMTVWGDCSQWALPRDVLDHCPIILRYSSLLWGPKPFRFNNHWLKHKDCNSVVSNCWTTGSFSGWMGYILKEKLKLLKGVLKQWNKETFGEVDSKIQLLVEEISAADLKGESLGLSPEEEIRRKEKFSALWGLLRSKESIVFQRSRSKWLKEGDANSRFFHSCVKARGSRNRISAVRVDGTWVEDVAGIRGAVTSYFSAHFSDEVWDRPVIDGIAFPSLSNDQISSL